MSFYSVPVAKCVLAIALVSIPLHAASAECMDEASSKPKLLERTQRAPQERVSVLAMPAKVAQWIRGQSKPEVVIGLTVKKPR